MASSNARSTEASKSTTWPDQPSLHWGLPVAISGLVAAAIGFVLFLAYREVTATLVVAGGTRAQTAADQLAGLVAQSVQQGVTALTQAANDDNLVQYVQQPRADRQEAVRQRLVPFTSAGPRRVELWDRGGTLLLDITNATATTGPARVDFPPTVAPLRDGVGPLTVRQDRVFAEVIAAVRATSPDGNGSPPTIGFVVVWSTLTINPPGILSRLVGADAAIAIGDQSSTAWSDFSRTVPAPRVDVRRPGIAEGRDSNGPSRIGAIAIIRGTPWSVWVSFPRALVVAPAQAFLSRISIIGLLVTVFAAGFVRLITGRLTTPLRDMTRAAGAIAGGDYSRRVETKRRDEIGQLGGALNAMADHIARDISRRQSAEEALQVAEERLRFALESSQVGVWDADIASGRARWSTVLEHLHGLAPGTFGASLDAFISHVHSNDREGVRNSIERAVRDHAEVSLLYRAVWSDGSVHWIRSLGRIFYDQTGMPLRAAGVSMDVTATRTLEEQLSQVHKMEAIGQLAGGVAHDFNNLLTAILGYANLVFDSLESSDARRDDVSEIIGAAQRAASLTRQLLTFSRKQVLVTRRVDVNGLVTETSALLGRLIGEHIQLVTALAPDLGAVQADPGQIQQILMNLAVNARDAMPNGGRLLIETNNVSLDGSYAFEHVEVRPGPYVMIAVTDQGVGMDEETKRRVFEPFFTTKEQGRGTGLGLATVYGIVKQSGGHIFVYSEPSKGATFKVYLPRAIGDAEAAAPSTSDRAPGGAETVLLVEDERAVRQLTRTILERAGYTVIEAASPEQARIDFRESRGDIALLITDVVMPGATGPELFQQLSAERPTLRVLYVSGYTTEAILHAGQLQAGTSFLSKPFTAELLTRTVRQVLDNGGRPLPGDENPKA